MKTLYTFGLMLLTGATMAQVPTDFGSNAEDGINYDTYFMVDHGSVRSIRFQAQNAIPEGDATWEFFTGNYEHNWRPYTSDDTLSSFDMMIDPSAETASARYNSGFGGQTGKLPAIQAGYYYTAIVGNAETADNFMSIIETDFDPVVIDTVYVTPTNPTETDAVVFTVELDGALMPSVGERVFLRSSVDGYTTSQFAEVTNFTNGIGTFTVPSGTIPAGTMVNYYALVTKEEEPVHETIDFHTLFFGNNNGSNYEFTVSSVTGIEDINAEFGIVQNNEKITVKNTTDLTSIELISIEGKMIASAATNGAATSLQTSDLSKGIYVLNLIGNDKAQSVKLFVD
ncbi:MAG: T9SS type A sorting domain-containing protein [Flavobacteriales bacterium]